MSDQEATNGVAIVRSMIFRFAEAVDDHQTSGETTLMLEFIYFLFIQMSVFVVVSYGNYLFAGSFQGRQRLQNAVDKRAVRIGHAFFETKQGLQVRIGEEQLSVGHQLWRLTQLSSYRMNEIRN